MLHYQTSPFYECVGYRAPTSQLVVHLQKQKMFGGVIDFSASVLTAVFNAVSTPTRCLTVSRCSLVMECLHGPGTKAIFKGKLRNISTHRHFTCN